MTSEQWPLKPLAELCTIFNGKSIPVKVKQEKYTIDQDGIPYIGTKDVGFDTTISYQTGVVIPSEDFANFRLAPENSVFVCAEGGSAGRKVAFTEKDVFFGNKLYAIVSGPEMNSKLIFYFCLSDSFQRQFKSRMSGIIGGVNQKKFKTIEIPVPPLEEQQRIASILDEAFDGLSKSLEKIEKKVNDADEYYDSYLSTLFNKLILEYDSKTLNDCCAEITVGYVGPMKSKYKENGIPFLRSKNVRPFSIVEDGITFIDETFNSSLSKSMLKPGDLVIVRTGYPGTAAVIPETMRVANCSDMVIVRTGPEVDPNYLAMFFNSSIGKKLVASNLVGAAQQHFNVGAAKKTKLPLPPIQIQQSMITESNLVRSLAKEIQSVNMENINNIAELKQSILQEAFNGELT